MLYQLFFCARIARRMVLGEYPDLHHRTLNRLSIPCVCSIAWLAHVRVLRDQLSQN